MRNPVTPIDRDATTLAPLHKLLTEPALADARLPYDANDPSVAVEQCRSRLASSALRPTKREKPRERETSSGVWSAPTPSNS